LNFPWQQPKKNGGVEPQVEVEDGGRKNEASVENENHNVMLSFTQLLTAPPTSDGSFYDENMF
jgi:hypothetical protein